LGPKLGLAILSSMDAEHVIVAITSGDTDLLTSIPGIGEKIAGRVILELKDKIGNDRILIEGLESVQSNGGVLAALTSLGYSVAEANRAMATLPISSNLSLEEK